MYLHFLGPRKFYVLTEETLTFSNPAQTPIARAVEAAGQDIGIPNMSCRHAIACARSKSLPGPNTGAYFVGSAERQFHQDREWVWARYGTTYRAMYTLYEITFAGRVQNFLFFFRRSSGRVWWCLNDFNLKAFCPK